MTVSVLALVTDMVRDGKPMIGYGFNSNGRYAPLPRPWLLRRENADWWCAALRRFAAYRSRAENPKNTGSIGSRRQRPFRPGHRLGLCAGTRSLWSSLV